MNQTHFLNIDLDIESDVEISILVKEIELSCCLMTYHEVGGVYRASFEVNAKGIENIIAKFVRIIESLSEQSKLLWGNCKKREFNLGFQSGSTPNGYLAVISTKSLSNILNVGGNIGITIYPETPKVT